jgi:hypothetical protein
VLVPEAPVNLGNDDFKNWAMNRSQAISADNTIAAGIMDDPSQTDDSTGLTLGGYSYFPLTGDPALGIGNPYGLSFWSPYQATLNSIYFPSYFYGSLYSGWPVRGWPVGGWPVGGRPSPRGPGPIIIPSPIGTRPPRTAPPRVAIPGYRAAPLPSGHAVAPVVGVRR